VVNATVPEKYLEESKYVTRSIELSCDTDLSAMLNPKFNVEVLGCSQCKQDCLDHLCPCALQKDGNYVYTKKGYLNEAWSNARYSLKAEFITECNDKCSCPNTCSNQVEQQRMIHDLEVWPIPCKIRMYFAFVFTCTCT
jgi:hypothetical protein